MGVPELLEQITKAPDVVSVQDYEDAIRTLSRVKGWASTSSWNLLPVALENGDITATGRQWRERAIVRLNEKLDAYFSDATVPRDQKQFLAMLKTMAHKYVEGSNALKHAAERFRNTHHDSVAANKAYAAHLVLARAAQELIGEEK